MVEALKSWVSNIIAIIFFITIIEVVLPNGSTKKYVGLVTGMLIIITIMTPVVKALGGQIDLKIPELNTSTSSLKSSSDEQIYKLNQIQTQQVLKVYKDKLDSEIKDTLKNLGEYSCKSVDCKVYGDTQKFGEVSEITINVVDKTKNNKLSRIKRVEVNINSNRDSNYIKTQQLPDKVKDKIINNVVAACGVEKTKIKIIYANEG